MAPLPRHGLPPSRGGGCMIYLAGLITAVAVGFAITTTGGWLGLFQADEDRIAARLRKMGGKNIGLMYFGLNMSSDPACMLYGRIGGHRNWMR